MGRGRTLNPQTPYRMREHKTGKYSYAATYPSETDGVKKRACRHWGRLKDGKLFQPNIEFLNLTPAEREKFIFPDDWDLSELKKLASHRGPGRPAYAQVDQDRLYGHVWLLEQLAVQLHLRSDLEQVFEGNMEMVDAVLSLAMYSIVMDKSFSHMADAQEDVRFPASRKLTSSVITRLSQAITEQNRMDLFTLRRMRAPKNNVCAVDSTSRCGWGNTLTNMTWGKSKEHLLLAQTSEVVAYSLTQHEPLYYRTFAGNTPDCRSLRVILEELRHAGFHDYIMVTDRGYETAENITLCILKGQKLLTAAQVGRRKFRDKVAELYAEGADPTDRMEWLPEQKVYAKQFSLEWKATGRGGRVVTAENLKLSVYCDMRKKQDQVEALECKVHMQREALQKMMDEKQPLPDRERRSYRFFNVTRNKETLVVEAFTRRDSAYQRAKRECGFFGFVTLGLDWNAKKTLTTYRLRDEQESYFHNMKDRIHADRQHCWSNRSMHGRRFIEFTALILVSRLNYAWSNSAKLRKLFPTVDHLLTEMSRIHCVEHTHRTQIITPFIGKQVEVCREFGFDIPKGCEPLYVKVVT